MSDAPLRDAFLQGMSRTAQTVNIVTTDGAAGRAGVTVSAMTSVSADGGAPTLLVCVHHLSAAAATILGNGCFAVNILRDDQSFIADTFAGRIRREDGDRFACSDWQAMTTGAPRVRDPLVAFDCRVVSSERIGTHHVFIGEVAETFVAPEGKPLVYANRAYSSPVRHLSTARPGNAVSGSPTAGTLRIGTLSSFGPSLLPPVLKALEAAQGPVALDLHEGDQRQLLELLRDGTIDLAFLYDFDLGPGITAMPVAEVAPYVLLPADDPLAASTEIALEALARRPMVLLDAPPSRDYFLSLFDGVEPPLVAYHAKSLEMVRGMVAQGLGYSILATKPAATTSHDGKPLVTRPLVGRHPASRLVLCGRKAASQPASVEAFIFHCAHTFGLDLE